MEGWIKLHRKLYEKGFSGMPDYVAIWLYILVHAQHKDQEIVLNKQVVKINRGSLITGRKKLSSVTGVSESKTYRILKYLEIEQQIEQQKFNKFTVISIVNYDKYQASEQEDAQQVNNRRTTDEQQMNTYKNVKKEKNEKKDKNLHTQSADESAAYSAEFSAWWSDWIKSISRGTGGKKQKAFEYFKRLKKTFTTQQIRDATANYMSSCRNTGSYHKDAEGFLNPNNGLVKQWYETQPVEATATAPRNQTTSSQLDDIFNRKSEEHNGTANTESYSQDTVSNNPAVQPAAIG